MTRTRPSLALLVALLALVVACGSTAVAAGLAKNSVGSKQIKNNAVKSKDVRNDTLSGTDIKEATLATVPNAAAVGGVRITPVDLSVLGSAPPVAVLQEAGSLVTVDCSGDTVLWEISRAPDGPMLTYSFVAGSAGVVDLGPNETVNANTEPGHFTFTQTVADGGATILDLFATTESNSGGGSEDCFFRGTLTRIP